MIRTTSQTCDLILVADEKETNKERKETMPLAYFAIKTNLWVVLTNVISISIKQKELHSKWFDYSY